MTDFIRWFEKVTWKRKLGFLIILYFILRLYQIHTPVVDRHSWNQITALSQSVNIYKDVKNNFLYPKVDFLDSSDTRIFGQEFPIYESLVALAFYFTGVQEWSARLVSLLLGVPGFIFGVLLCRKLYDDNTAFWSGLFICFSSLSWFFDRAIATDVGMVSFAMMSLYYGKEYVDQGKLKSFFLCVLFLNISALFKPFGLIVVAVIGLYILQQKKYKLIYSPLTIACLLLSLVPTYFWVSHISTFERSTSSASSALGFDWEILFSWRYLEVLVARFFDNAITPYVAPFFLYFLFSKRIKSDFVALWLIGYSLYLVIIAGGNREHSYYQLIFVIPICVGTAKGLLAAFDFSKLSKKKLALFSLLLFLHFTRSIYIANNHFKQDIGPYLVGKKIESFNLPAEAKMINFDPAGTQMNQMVYYSGQLGWTIRNLDLNYIARLKEKGAVVMGVHLIKESNNFTERLPKLKKNMNIIWESYDCVDRYKKPCYMAVVQL